MPDVVDDLGTVVPVPDEPARIVSLVPNLSEVLAGWGLAQRVVGVTEWCVAEGAFGRARRVRGPKNPDVRGITALAPDVVVANEEENRELDVRRLREAGMTVYVTRVRTVAGAAETLRRLGAALGMAASGRELADELHRAVLAAATDRAPVVTLCPIWRDPWMVVGRETFAGDLLARCGAHVWHPSDDARYPRIDLDDARAADLGLVLLPDEPYAFDESDRGVFDGWDVPVRLIDGADLTWWGTRTPAAVRRLSATVADA